ncbi:MAG: hypothetical protein ACHQUB_01305 [Candidatus Saccharimonadia bacterium]
MILRVLVIGDDQLLFDASDLRSRKFEVETQLDDLYDFWDSARGGHYHCSEKSLDRARSASADHFDAVVIAHNDGVGLRYAKALPTDMREKTMILWNKYLPKNDTPYAALGYRYFGQRSRFTEGEGMSIAEFLAEMADVKVLA